MSLEQMKERQQRFVVARMSGVEWRPGLTRMRLTHLPKASIGRFQLAIQSARRWTRATRGSTSPVVCQFELVSQERDASR
jgi:hypothetical protein